MRRRRQCTDFQARTARRGSHVEQEILPQASKTGRQHPCTDCTSGCSEPLGKRVNQRSRPKSTTLASQQQGGNAAPRALRNTLMTGNGTEKLDNELITTLFENITTLAQLHQLTRAEEKTTKDRPHNQKKRHITQ